MRSIAGSISLVCGFYAMTHYPVSEVLTLTNMFPLWVAVLSLPLLGEWPSFDVWPAVAVCGGSFAIMQFLWSNFVGPELVDITAENVTLSPKEMRRVMGFTIKVKLLRASEAAKAAAEKAGLREVGLSYHDVYGVIEAETSWIPRTGASKNGTPNLGLAQFEPRTAQGMGLKDPNDPVQAVFAAAQYMRMGAQWASGKIGHLKSDPALYAAKLREGVSVHYNLSVKGRNKWNGLNTAQLPVETQRHIRNAALGAREAAELARKFSV